MIAAEQAHSQNRCNYSCHPERSERPLYAVLNETPGSNVEERSFSAAEKNFK
jgi:hypothetical protein